MADPLRSGSRPCGDLHAVSLWKARLARSKDLFIGLREISGGGQAGVKVLFGSDALNGWNAGFGLVPMRLRG